MTESYNQRAWKASKGPLQPSSRQIVGPGIYDELIMPPPIAGVTFNRVVLLAGVQIQNNSARGTIILPKDTETVDLGGSLVNVLYWPFEKICREFNA